MDMLVFALALTIAVLDQITKQIVRYSFDLGETRPVIEGFFSLTYVRNTGAAWGILGGQNAFLILLSVVMLFVILRYRRSFMGDSREHRLALGLMLGGIVGNLMDRVRLEFVTDFLDFYWRGHHWPAFNVADAAICVGVGLYVLSSIWMEKHPLEKSIPPAAGGPGQPRPE
jgi:signal peptidase II